MLVWLARAVLEFIHMCFRVPPLPEAEHERLPWHKRDIALEHN